MPNLNLKNFAKIKDSNFDIKDITVFAGKPGTGKSYIMKTIYAIDECYYKYNEDNIMIKDDVDHLSQEINLLRETVSKYKIDKAEIPTEIFLDIHSKLNNIQTRQDKHKKFVEMNKQKTDADIFKNIINAIFGDATQISSKFKIKYNNNIINYNASDFHIKIDKNNLPMNNIFVETPLILEFKQFMNREEGKTPYHIESLLKILDKDYSFTDNEQDRFIKSFIEKSKNIIGGSIKNSGDSFIFKTSTTDYNIVNASSGIKSIGLLQYLVTNKALKKGSTLFWEEPEVHLHPTWQLKMIDLFIELMNAGVKIVFSTHSPFMADYLNAKTTKEKFRDRISFNLLSEEKGVVSNTILDDSNWNLLQSELLNPLEEIMWEYL